jgi:hypothetical protein
VIEDVSGEHSGHLDLARDGMNLRVGVNCVDIDHPTIVGVEIDEEISSGRREASGLHVEENGRVDWVVYLDLDLDLSGLDLISPGADGLRLFALGFL